MLTNVLAYCRASWKVILVIVTPIILTPMVFPFDERSQESKCGYMIVIMTVYWITEAIPLSVTAIIPIAMAPLLGVASSSRLCKVFFEDISFLLIGGTIVAIAIEETMLHKRIALKILLFIGVEPRRLLLGVMATTAFLSMWISNMATTAMMMPITRALLVKLLKTTSEVDGGRCQGHDALSPDSNVSIEIDSSVTREATPTFSAEECQENNTTTEMMSLFDNTNNTQENATNTRSGPKQASHREDDPKEEDASVLNGLNSSNMAVLKTFSLCVCYSANIGGMATLTGTAPNMVMSRMVADMYKEVPVTFANWFFFGFPIALLLLAGTYIWMNINGFGFRSTLTCTSISSPERTEVTRLAIQHEIKQLGTIKFNEVVVLGHFIVLVLLWLLRAPGTFPGWTTFFKPGYVTDASVAMMVACSLFAFPNSRPNVLFFKSTPDAIPSSSTASILTWKRTMRKFPWGVIFLCGGGFALSEAIKVSGLSKLIASNLLFVRVLPVWAACSLVVLLASSVTEIISNTVVTVLILPMLKELALEMDVHPLYLMLPAAAASSLAFMLPIATPPNALVFAYGDIKVVDMVKSGLILNTMGILVITLAINTWGYFVFNMATIPYWAVRALGHPSNATLLTLNVTQTGNL